jgi:hypothetical protein
METFSRIQFNAIAKHLDGRQGLRRQGSNREIRVFMFVFVLVVPCNVTDTDSFVFRKQRTADSAKRKFVFVVFLALKSI